MCGVICRPHRVCTHPHGILLSPVKASIVPPRSTSLRHDGYAAERVLFFSCRMAKSERSNLPSSCGSKMSTGADDFGFTFRVFKYLKIFFFSGIIFYIYQRHMD